MKSLLQSNIFSLLGYNNAIMSLAVPSYQAND